MDSMKTENKTKTNLGDNHFSNAHLTFKDVGGAFKMVRAPNSKNSRLMEQGQKSLAF